MLFAEQERSQIVEVAIDKPYSSVCEELLPNADITVNRCHVAKAINDELKALKNQAKSIPKSSKVLTIVEKSRGFNRRPTGETK